MDFEPNGLSNDEPRQFTIYCERYAFDLWDGSYVETDQWVLSVSHEESDDWGIEPAVRRNLFSFDTGLPIDTPDSELKGYLENRARLVMCGIGITDPGSIEYFNRPVRKESLTK